MIVARLNKATRAVSMLHRCVCGAESAPVAGLRDPPLPAGWTAETCPRCRPLRHIHPGNAGPFGYTFHRRHFAWHVRRIQQGLGGECLSCSRTVPPSPTLDGARRWARAEAKRRGEDYLEFPWRRRP